MEQVDEIVSAEIPPHPNTIFDQNEEKQQEKREQAKRLRELVLKNMVHGPCGKENPNAPCMYNADGEITQVCSKKFPKEFTKETVYDPNNSYVRYKRRDPKDGGVDAEYNNRILDSSWIVPYSPYLTLKFGCHINIEICASSKATKYLYKYVNKGGDRAMLKVDKNGQPLPRNEVKEFQDLRSIGASEACWRTFEFPMSNR